MKKLLLLLHCLICLISNAQIINFSDINFKEELLEQSSLGIDLDANSDGEIQVSEALNWEYSLNLGDANISDLSGIEYFTNISHLDVHDNNLSQVDLSSLTNLQHLKIDNNLLTVLDVSNLINLKSIQCYNNLLTSLDFSGLTNIRSINCRNNLLNSLIFSDNQSLIHLFCDDNLLTNLDVSECPILISLKCSSNNLTALNLKNSALEYSIDFSDNNNLEYICADGEQLIEIEDMIDGFGYVDCYTNSLCNYNEFEPFYAITGNVKYDEDNDGCGSSDINNEGIQFVVTNSVNTGSFYTDLSGDYQFNVQNGTYLVTPVLPNSTYYNIFPENITATFPDNASPLIQDFCITPAGSYPDLEIFIFEEELGYGYYGTYKVVFKNKGTMTQSGSVHFSFDDDIVDFNSSAPDITSQTTNQITWDFINLLPFETREIEISLNFNDPNDTPPLQDGDILTFSAEVTSNLPDETPSNNTFILNQDFFCCLLSTPEVVFSDFFTLYPNPAKTYLNLQMKKFIEVTKITLFDIMGKQIQMFTPQIGSIKTDVSHLVAGHYIVKISTPKKDFFTRFLKAD